LVYLLFQLSQVEFGAAWQAMDHKPFIVLTQDIDW
jgi:hypothetical protein